MLWRVGNVMEGRAEQNMTWHIVVWWVDHER